MTLSLHLKSGTVTSVFDSVSTVAGFLGKGNGKYYIVLVTESIHYICSGVFESSWRAPTVFAVNTVTLYTSVTAFTDSLLSILTVLSMLSLQSLHLNPLFLLMKFSNSSKTIFFPHITSKFAICIPQVTCIFCIVINNSLFLFLPIVLN